MIGGGGRDEIGGGIALVAIDWPLHDAAVEEVFRYFPGGSWEPVVVSDEGSRGVVIVAECKSDHWVIVQAERDSNGWVALEVTNECDLVDWCDGSIRRVWRFPVESGTDLVEVHSSTGMERVVPKCGAAFVVSHGDSQMPRGEYQIPRVRRALVDGEWHQTVLGTAVRREFLAHCYLECVRSTGSEAFDWTRDVLELASSERAREAMGVALLAIELAANPEEAALVAIGPVESLLEAHPAEVTSMLKTAARLSPRARAAVASMWLSQRI